jgi:hypothetical protein
MYNVAKTLEEPADWTFNRIRAMEAIQRDKYRRNKEFRDKLKTT